MAKSRAHVVSPGRVWIVEGNRQDNGNALYYKVWAGMPDAARAYLKRTDLKGIAVNFTACRENTNGRYEWTLNCFRDHPERYEQF
jgi:hypothetical protein